MNYARHLIVRGRVQGVGFRAWIVDMAEERYLEGWVRNRRDGTVEALLVGREEAVNAVVDVIRKGPPGAKVEGADVKEGDSAMLKLRPPRTRFAVVPSE